MRACPSTSLPPPKHFPMLTPLQLLEAPRPSSLHGALIFSAVPFRLQGGVGASCLALALQRVSFRAGLDATSFHRKVTELLRTFCESKRLTTDKVRLQSRSYHFSHSYSGEFKAACVYSLGSVSSRQLEKADLILGMVGLLMGNENKGEPLVKARKNYMSYNRSLQSKGLGRTKQSLHQ